MKLSKAQVIERMCSLVTEVGRRFGDQLCHDCFCGENPVQDKYFCVDEGILEFIEAAVRAKHVIP